MDVVAEFDAFPGRDDDEGIDPDARAKRQLSAINYHCRAVDQNVVAEPGETETFPPPSPARRCRHEAAGQARTR
jgi:hypothetical protein